MAHKPSVIVSRSDTELDIIIDNQHDQLSLNQSNNGKTDYKLMTLVWISRAIPGGAGIFCIFYLFYLMSDPTNWSTDENSSDQDKLNRTQNRGLFVSILIALLMNLIGAFMFHIRVKESLVITNYGFILGPVIGYMLDQAIGTDDGFRIFMTAEGFSYTFGSLIGGNFMRYIVTVFLDLFISNPLQDVLKVQAIELGVIEVLREEDGKKYKFQIKYDHMIAMIYPSILQSIIAFVTFNAYTNQTRFAWAYPDETLARELRIPPGTIMLCTSIAGVVYLNFYTIMDYISDREYFDVGTKIFYVVTILFLLYVLNATDSIEAPVEDEEDEELTRQLGWLKPWLGILVFIGFVIYGFIYPIYTRLGCCGYCKPDINDHDIDDPSTAKIRKSPRYKTAYINRDQKDIQNV